jgi:hypothetical protein
LEDEDGSDDDIGKPMKSGLDYDSDEKNDEELLGGMGTSSAGATSELIDLGNSVSEPAQNARKAAAKIPKLSGPH